jgi:hypothetical protein
LKTIRSNVARFIVGSTPLIYSQALLEPAVFLDNCRANNTSEQLVDY